MARIETQSAPLRIRQQRPCPVDFDETFVRIGRQACEEHYRVRRTTVDRWLGERGKARLIQERYEAVASLGRGSPRGPAKRLTRQDVGQIIAAAWPVPDPRRVSITLARHAAQFLRIMRNGGMIISPTGDGDWRVGIRRMSAAQLVDLAKSKGFGTDLTGSGE